MDNAIARRLLLERLYDKLSDEDKRLYVQLSAQDKGREEILQALSRQDEKIEDVSRKIGSHPFATDLLSNILGNGITDGLVWLGARLIRKL